MKVDNYTSNAGHTLIAGHDCFYYIRTLSYIMFVCFLRDICWQLQYEQLLHLNKVKTFLTLTITQV